jgi:Tol biopolymer transport system component
MGAGAAAVMSAGWIAWSRPAPAPGAGVTYASITFPRDVEPLPSLASGFGVSPDGRQVFMIGVKDGRRRLFLRSLDRLDVTEIPDPSGVNGAAFSPDGGSMTLLVGGGVVTRLSLADRQRTVVTTTADISGGLAWGDAGIVFSRGGALWMAPADGSGPRSLTGLDAARHEVMHDSPLMLPGGRLVLFSSMSPDPGTDRVEVVKIDDGARAVVVERASTPIFVRPGHLLFARDGAIFAVPIDPETAVLRGTALPVIPAGRVEIGAAGSLTVRVSASGTLVMVPAGFNAGKVWSVARDGSAQALDLPSARYSNPRVSPDGRRLLIERSGTVLSAFDFARGTLAEVSGPAYGTNFGTWSTTADRVVFRMFNLPVWMSADGSGRAMPVPGTDVNSYPAAPGPDADSIFMVRLVEGSSGDISLVSISGAFAAKSIVATPSYDGGPALSPDRRWLLFVSTMSGQAEAYVKPYPGLDRQWQVSAGGGTQARWSPDGKEIYYRAHQRFVAVPFGTTHAEPVIGKAVLLFADTYDFGPNTTLPNYDVTHDGRFIVTGREAGDGGLQIGVNWERELERILAAGGAR